MGTGQVGSWVGTIIPGVIFLRKLDRPDPISSIRADDRPLRVWFVYDRNIMSWFAWSSAHIGGSRDTATLALLVLQRAYIILKLG